MPPGNQYHARAVQHVLEAVAEAIRSYAESPPELSRESMVDLLKATLQIADESQARLPREEQDFQELRASILAQWQEAFGIEDPES